jgi:predicted metal-dependent enzyme (double-stranded beta helix superfamily)
MGDESRTHSPHGADEVVAAVQAAAGDVEEAAATVARLVRAPSRLEAALGVEDRCGVTVLTRSPRLTVQRVVWPAGIRIPPHDHRMWAVVGVYRGREDNALFRRDGATLEGCGDRQIEEGGVLVLHADAIHAVANGMSTPCVALHVYGGDLDGTPRSTWAPDEQPFDPDRMWHNIARLRRREDELGRALTPEETAALTRGG